MNFKRFTAGGLAAAAALTVSVFLPPAASADAMSNCPPNMFCVWAEPMYSGPIEAFAVAGDGITGIDIGVSSYWNRTTIDLCAISTAHIPRKIVSGEQSAHLEDGWNHNLVGFGAAVVSGHARC